MTTAALARAPRAARLSSPELATAVQAPSLGALASAKPANVQLRNGDPFILELQLRIPLGFAFNAPFVERLFRAPPGMRVADQLSPFEKALRGLPTNLAYQSLDVMEKLLKNIAQNPREGKFRRIK